MVSAQRCVMDSLRCFRKTIIGTLTRPNLKHNFSISNRDRGKPCDSPPPTPPGIRITYHGGSVD
jgi:hypothetical protein